MTKDAGLLNDTELAAVAGGGPTLIRTSTIVLPHIPRDRDLLTPQQIEKILQRGFQSADSERLIVAIASALARARLPNGGEFFPRVVRVAAYPFERRHVAGAVPNAFLKAREKAASEP